MEFCGPIPEIGSKTSKELSEICMGNQMGKSEVKK